MIADVLKAMLEQYKDSSLSKESVDLLWLVVSLQRMSENGPLSLL